MVHLIAFAQSSRVDFSGIELWNTSNVINMCGMFYCCEMFNQPLNDWVVREDCIVSGLFAGCYKQSYKNIANAFSENQISIIGRDLDYMAREL